MDRNTKTSQCIRPAQGETQISDHFFEAVFERSSGRCFEMNQQSGFPFELEKKKGYQDVL